MYSYTMIYDCGKIWFKGNDKTEIESEWTRYAQMISYPMSSKCRRAHLLPLFDDFFSADSTCDRCDNCIVRIAGTSAVLNVTTAARLMLEVIEECTSRSQPTVQISRVRDIMLG